MLNCLTFFINYTKTPGLYVLLADHTKVPVLGKGDAKFCSMEKLYKSQIVSIYLPSPHHYTPFSTITIMPDVPSLQTMLDAH
mmetsp:Transcript_14186/g.20765  ORF Transcript_14186/g.20765 Transcript_14186/m.20765 type:complete len:82 (+) Transcript_14186:2453-2698(+)